MKKSKLSEITQKLYEEGLSKGRAEGEQIVAEAEARAKQIIARAKETAVEIMRKAIAQAAELLSNTMTEIALAGRKAVAHIKDYIAGVVVAHATGESTRKATHNRAFTFIKEMLPMLLAVARLLAPLCINIYIDL